VCKLKTIRQTDIHNGQIPRLLLYRRNPLLRAIRFPDLDVREGLLQNLFHTQTHHLMIIDDEHFHQLGPNHNATSSGADTEAQAGEEQLHRHPEAFLAQALSAVSSACQRNPETRLQPDLPPRSFVTWNSLEPSLSRKNAKTPMSP
jgi:hypothetical protein